MSAACLAGFPPATQSVRFLLTADAGAGLLPRLLQPFARRDLMPDLLCARRCGERIVIEIAMTAMPAEDVHLIEGNLRQVVGVQHLARCGC